MIPKNLVLENDLVRLEPLDFCHAGDLCAAGRDERVWDGPHRGHQMPTLDAVLHYIGEARYGNRTAPDGIPFAIIDKPTGKAVGCTRFFDISEPDRRLEIGWTWIGAAYWRTHLNTTCKLLLLTYAFEVAKMNRVQFKADSGNERSRAAIERLGATYEGTLREVRASHDSMRGVSIYSILADEWPAVKVRLAGLLRQANSGVEETREVPHFASDKPTSAATHR